ncbi:MAG TPA: GNAT family N-acetyltransferase [Kofleriaceae bacterium]|nr:GNAT family N-acetyltransferase [Kofleriaceae bacterium]
MNVGPLARARLAEAELVLADACAFDRATEVADEKLFGPGPTSAAQAFGAWDGNELIGVGSVAARWLRLIAVTPRARTSGAGSALLAAIEAAARADGQTRLSALDQPGNYLAPGIDERNAHAIAWLERRGFTRGADLRTNLLLDVRQNPRISRERAAEAAELAHAHGYEVRRAKPAERQHLLDAIAGEFGGAWPYEVERALGHAPAAIHVACKDGAYCAFAAHDGNNRGLGWFGPAGTWKAHRGKGLGEALLLACLVDVAAEHSQCEVAWIGPRPFYEKVVGAPGIVGERRFVSLTKLLG